MILVEQCLHGLNEHDDGGFIAISSDIGIDAKRLISEMVRMPDVSGPYDGALSVYSLDGDRIAVQCTQEDRDRFGRAFPYSHILVFRKKDYAKVGANPYWLKREGYFKNKVERSPTIEPLQIDTAKELENKHNRQLFPNEVWEALMSAILGQKRTYVTLDAKFHHYKEAILETLLASMPLRFRTEVSFCDNLRSRKEKSLQLINEIKDSLAGEPKNYETKFNIIAPDLSAFHAHGEEAKIAISEQETTIGGIRNHPLATMQREWVEAGHCVEEWCALLEQPDLQNAKFDALQQVQDQHLQLNQQTSIDDLVRWIKDYRKSSSPLKSLYHHYRKIIEIKAKAFENMNAASRETLAHLAHEAELDSEIENALLRWADKHEPGFFAFYQFYNRSYSTPPSVVSEIATTRREILAQKPDESECEEFRYWISQLNNEEFNQWLDRHFSQFKAKNGFAKYYGYYFLENWDTFYGAVKDACAKDKRRKSESIWLPLLSELTPNLKEKQARVLITTLFEDWDIQRHALPGEWPEVVKELTLQDNNLLNLWAEVLLTKGDASANTSFIGSFCDSRVSEPLFLRAWLKQLTVDENINNKVLASSIDIIRENFEKGRPEFAPKEWLGATASKNHNFIESLSKVSVDLEFFKSCLGALLDQATDYKEIATYLLNLPANAPRKEIVDFLKEIHSTQPGKIKAILDSLSASLDSEERRWWAAQIKSFSEGRKGKSKQKKIKKTEPEGTPKRSPQNSAQNNKKTRRAPAKRKIKEVTGSVKETSRKSERETEPAKNADKADLAQSNTRTVFIEKPPSKWRKIQRIAFAGSMFLNILTFTALAFILFFCDVSWSKNEPVPTPDTMNASPQEDYLSLAAKFMRLAIFGQTSESEEDPNRILDDEPKQLEAPRRPKQIPSGDVEPLPRGTRIPSGADGGSGGESEHHS